MGLLDEARNGPHNGPVCALVRVLEQHPTMADEIKAIISDSSISMRHAAAVFARYDIDIAEHSIKRHRSNICVTCRKQGLVW